MPIYSIAAGFLLGFEGGFWGCMVVRVRWKPPDGGQRSNQHRQLALLLAALLTPSALIAFTLAFWIIASEMRWTGEFFVASGLLSHWQVWLCTAGVLLALSRLLDRYAQGQ
jgi:hypothetical protein